MNSEEVVYAAYNLWFDCLARNSIYKDVCRWFRKASIESKHPFPEEYDSLQPGHYKMNMAIATWIADVLKENVVHRFPQHEDDLMYYWIYVWFGDVFETTFDRVWERIKDSIPEPRSVGEKIVSDLKTSIRNRVLESVDKFESREGRRPDLEELADYLPSVIDAYSPHTLFLEIHAKGVGLVEIGQAVKDHVKQNRMSNQVGEGITSFTCELSASVPVLSSQISNLRSHLVFYDTLPKGLRSGTSDDWKGYILEKYGLSWQTDKRAYEAKRVGLVQKLNKAKDLIDNALIGIFPGKIG
ncbi:MAG TPA: hypothetical protein PKB11_04860 [Desulfovibrio sp.]|uniref:hypothetical protein n=1 Tax=Desulfovibrio sp. TaxID=885 RepID=UPI002C4CBBFA|nr:hypothetical protein [Desulfovibrio sp.]HMM38068.1 hypothetical protein [Desulfovibrio sp.]